MRSVQELAWAAGIFEGEGTIRINRPNKHDLGHLAVSIVSTDPQVVEFFMARWPGYHKRATGLGPRQKPAWVWAVASRKAAAFLREVLPYFRRNLVRERAWTALVFQESKAMGSANRSLAYREEQFNAYHWMRELNVRGVDPEPPR